MIEFIFKILPSAAALKIEVEESTANPLICPLWTMNSSKQAMNPLEADYSA